MEEIKKIQDRLDDLFARRSSDYYDFLQTVKSMGHRVFRNSEGKHIVNVNVDYIKEAFGGAFKDVF